MSRLSDYGADRRGFILGMLGAVALGAAPRAARSKGLDMSDPAQSLTAMLRL